MVVPVKSQYVIRVIRKAANDSTTKDVNEVIRETEETLLLDCLAYAGAIKLSAKHFDILPPAGVNSNLWAERNATRMQTFGYNAVAAPRDRD